LAINRFITTHYVVVYKTIHMYFSHMIYLMSHVTSLNNTRDDLISCHVVSNNKLTVNQFVVKLCSSVNIYIPYKLK
jgi:hypothetical protein